MQSLISKVCHHLKSCHTQSLAMFLSAPLKAAKKKNNQKAPPKTRQSPWQKAVAEKLQKLIDQAEEKHHKKKN